MQQSCSQQVWRTSASGCLRGYILVLIPAVAALSHTAQLPTVVGKVAAAVPPFNATEVEKVEVNGSAVTLPEKHEKAPQAEEAWSQDADAALGLLAYGAPKFAAEARRSRLACIIAAATWGIGRALCYFFLLGLPCLMAIIALVSWLESEIVKPPPEPGSAEYLLTAEYFKMKRHVRNEHPEMLCPEIAIPENQAYVPVMEQKGKKLRLFVCGAITNAPQTGKVSFVTEASNVQEAEVFLTVDFGIVPESASIIIRSGRGEAVAFMDMSHMYNYQTRPGQHRFVGIHRCQVDGKRKESQPFAQIELAMVARGQLRLHVRRYVPKNWTQWRPLQAWESLENMGPLLMQAIKSQTGKDIAVEDPDGGLMGKLDYNTGVKDADADLKIAAGADVVLVICAMIAAFKFSKAEIPPPKEAAK